MFLIKNFLLMIARLRGSVQDLRTLDPVQVPPLMR